MGNLFFQVIYKFNKDDKVWINMFWPMASEDENFMILYSFARIVRKFEINSTLDLLSKVDLGPKFSTHIYALAKLAIYSIAWPVAEANIRV